MRKARITENLSNVLRWRLLEKMSTLDLSCAELGCTAAAHALHELRAAPTAITALDLSRNAAIFAPATAGALSTIDELCALLAESDALTSLDLSGTNLGPADASKLAMALRRNTALRSVGLKNCKNAAPVLSALLMR